MTTRAMTMEAKEASEKPYNANNPDEVNAARIAAGRAKKAERDTLTALMEHSNGRKLMYDSIYPFLNGNPLVPSDPYSTFYNLGQEQRARELFREIVNISPDDFVKMMEENQ